MSTPEFTDLKWVVDFGDLCRELQNPRDRQSRDSARERVWLLLNSAISEYLRIHSTRMGTISREDVEDITAQKSSDLLRRLVLHTWDVSDRSSSEISAFLSKVAKNGLVDRLREDGRRVELTKGEQSDWDLDAADLAAAGSTLNLPDPPDNLVERREFARALRQCAEELDSRSRRVWFLRVLCEMPSKKIATHPQVLLEVNHVDVLLHRARHAIRRCMRQKGHEPGDMPPGTFVELWTSCRFDEMQESAGAVT